MSQLESGSYMYGWMSSNYQTPLTKKRAGKETLNLEPCKLMHTIASELRTLACFRVYLVQMLSSPSPQLKYIQPHKIQPDTTTSSNKEIKRSGPALPEPREQHCLFNFLPGYLILCTNSFLPVASSSLVGKVGKHH